MFICPICKYSFDTEDSIVKHSLKCWKNHNSNHIAMPASQGEDIVIREVNDDISNFFAMLKRS